MRCSDNALEETSGARVYASRIEAEATAAGRPSRELKRRGIFQALLFARLAPMLRAKSATVDEILSGGQELPVLGGLRVIDTPGHISLFAPSARILFAGDSMGSRDGGLRASRGANTWDEAKAVESVRAQAALDPQIVCVGHGPIVTDAAGKFPQV
jgi:glyoxylase-like metal-dependent hydrolase (beta-lactamase superfamily II)